MLVMVHSRGFEMSRELRSDVLEKVESAFTRFQNQIRKVEVYLADDNGPKKGLDKSIRLTIDLKNRPMLAVLEKGEGWQPMLEGIADRAVHTITRNIGRLRRRKTRIQLDDSLA
jgi:putative sigma-54 modulation protein